MYAMLSLVLLVAIALGVISVNFNRLSFKDSFPLSGDYTALYPASYESARHRFTMLSDSLAAIYSGVQCRRVSVPSAVDQDLSMGVCYIPAMGSPSNLIILCSGVHGVEGYAGHAAQELFVKRFINPVMLSKTGVLLIHSVNPYGFKYTRRVTENNVDLNRNSTADSTLYDTRNDGYTKVYDLINPQGAANVSSLRDRFFFLKAINEIRRASLPVLRQAVLQGQYQSPEGLYFGGQRVEPQVDSLKAIITEVASPYRRVLMIDIHTGYGERGKLHFFPNPMEEPQRQQLEALYEGYRIDWGDSDDFYTVTGELIGLAGQLLEGKEFYPMAYEYGTMDSQTTLGSLKSIHLMILENQGEQHGYRSAHDSVRVKHDHLEMYSPQSAGWRNYVMDQTREVFEAVLPRFLGDDGN